MNTFSKQIQEKKANDARILDKVSRRIYEPLQTKKESIGQNDGFMERTASELSDICLFFGISNVEFPSGMQDAESLMQFMMSESGILRRKVVLTKNWWKDGVTPLLCSDIHGNAVALLPAGGGGYQYHADGKTIAVTQNNAGQFLNACYCFYQPMPNTGMTTKDFIHFLCKSFQSSDVIWLLSISLLAGLLGLIMPKLNQFIFHSVVPSGTSKELFGIGVLIVGTVFMQAFCQLARAMWVMRIGNKMELLTVSGIWSRVLSLPVRFFEDYSSGELSDRAGAVNTICAILGGQLVPTLLGTVFSVVYLFEIRSISPTLLGPSLVIVLCIVAVNLAVTYLQMKQTAHNNRVESRLSGMVFELLGGMTKIKAAGAETRAFEKWAKVYSEKKQISNGLLLCSEALNAAMTFGGTILLYRTAFLAEMSASDYIAFHTAFGLITAAVMAMLSISAQLAALKPALEMLKPILEAEPENDGYRNQVTSLTGDIDVNQVKFRYQKNLPYVLNGLNLHIEPGDYIGIVGSSGCGKSTLMRILLGFEKPESGSVYYDMQDMNGLDLRTLRRRIGVVPQNGKLFSGDIYSNIVICAPWLSVDEAWEAAERSGFAEDIKQMPMGMFTMLSEGGGGLSGGQKQRLLIARALAGDPDLIMFDEATSALDNITQELVVKTLENMTCTRIVIAHRLSTIRNCSRIIYMHQGKIVESGTYEELMQLDGKFAKMAERQLV